MNLVCGICGTHGGYETAEVRNVRKIGGGRGLCGGPGKKVGGVFPGRCQSFQSGSTSTSGRLQPRTPESTATFSVEAAGQVYNQTNEFLYLEGNVNHNVDLSIEIDRRIYNAWCSFRKYTLEPYDRPSALLELKTQMIRAELLETMLYGCITWNSRACHYDTLRPALYRLLTRCIGWRKHNRADHPISHLDPLIKTGSEGIEAILRRR